MIHSIPLSLSRSLSLCFSVSHFLALFDFTRKYMYARSQTCTLRIHVSLHSTSSRYIYYAVTHKDNIHLRPIFLLCILFFSTSFSIPHIFSCLTIYLFRDLVKEKSIFLKKNIHQIFNLDWEKKGIIMGNVLSISVI